MPSPADGRARAQSFPPVWRADARVLILGSMPGVASLAAGRYYAHPRNQFWPLLGTVLGFDASLDYADRLRRLQDAGIALWDVLLHCERPGSLDSAIRAAGRVPNDLAALLVRMPALRLVLFNGQAAAKLFHRHVPLATGSPLRVERLPSTSPAHAGVSFDAKLALWRTALRTAGL